VRRSGTTLTVKTCVSAAAYENRLGQKRKWDNSGLQEDSLQRRMSNGGNNDDRLALAPNGANKTVP
jgi:hypothetical protein